MGSILSDYQSDISGALSPNRFIFLNPAKLTKESCSSSFDSSSENVTTIFLLDCSSPIFRPYTLLAVILFAGYLTHNNCSFLYLTLLSRLSFLAAISSIPSLSRPRRFSHSLLGTGHVSSVLVDDPFFRKISKLFILDAA